MEKITFIVLCVMAIFMIVLAIVGVVKGKPAAKVVPLGVLGGGYAVFAYALFSLPWK